MIRKQNLFLLILLFGVITPPLKTMGGSEESSEESQEEYSEEATTEQNQNKGLLIFLDDSESDTAHGDQKLGAISIQFLCAFMQNAGPIIVSASLIANVRERPRPKEANPDRLFDMINNLDVTDDAQQRTAKQIILSTVSFNKTNAKKWVIKRINDALYLLLPNKLLTTLSISKKDVQRYLPDKPLTTLEKELGLKINHLQTVVDIDEIKKPMPEPATADYFMHALWDETQKISTIFVTNNEYQKADAVPIWSFLFHGHGSMKKKIISLTIAQCKQLLTFSEYKIRTRLFYYISCYGASINNKLLYEETESAIQTTYSFAIITQALTDATVVINCLRFKTTATKLVPEFVIDYPDFLQKITAPEVIDYRTIDPFVESTIGGLPQIKFPGLPWFSVMNDDMVCSIGSVLAKARKTPLNIATFFAKEGREAAPAAVLLYAHDLLFELIINTKSAQPPAIISMIPGSAAHTIKKITSFTYTIEKLLHSFLQVTKLKPQKIFIIDSLSGLNEEGEISTIDDIIILLTDRKNIIYFMQNAILFKIVHNTIKQANGDDITNYLHLLEKAKQDTSVLHGSLTPAAMSKIERVQKKKISEYKKQEKTPQPETTGAQ